MHRFFYLFLILFVSGNSFVKAADFYIKSEDFYKIKRIIDCKFSPNGKLIAYVTEEVDRDNNSYINNIWLMPKKGGTALHLTTSSFRDLAPTWSPDGKYIAFTSNRSGRNQIWVIAVEGGEAWALTDMPHGAYSPVWSPDGTKIAFLAPTGELQPPEQKNNGSAISIEGEREYATDVRIIRNLRYRYNTKYFNGLYTHIFVISLTTKRILQLTDGDFHDSTPQWSPDSKLIAFTSNRSGNPHFDNNSDIYVVPATGGKIKRLTTAPGPENNPRWSPDGKFICYSGKTRPNDYALQSDLWKINISTKKITPLTAYFDRIPLQHQWSPDGKNILFLSPDRGNTHLYSLSLRNQKIKKIVSGRRQLLTFHPASSKIAFVATNNTNPGDLYICNMSGKQEKRLTAINKRLFNKIVITEPEEFFYTSFDGTKIQGWLLKPVPFSPQKKYPLIVEIHGGPHWFYGNHWFLEFHLLAAQGFAVFYCNPRNSIGYGQKFVTLGKGKWGEGDFNDIMTGIDVVLQKKFIDSTRIGITGGSYGGFMTNWIISHSNRFKAAVTQRSLSNLVSFYGTTDIQNFVESEFGLPWENFEKLDQHSPIRNAHRITTPLLIIHSERDFRVPIGQAEELFTILKRNNIDVTFIRYPNEGHELSRRGQPLHRVDRYNRIIDWFNKYLKP